MWNILNLSNGRFSVQIVHPVHTEHDVNDKLKTLQVTRLVDSAIAVKGTVESGLARELAVTLVHAPHFESKVRYIQV